MALRAHGKKAIQAAVDHKESFRHESLRAEWYVKGWSTVPKGRYPSAAIAPHTSDEPMFVIFSYQTPIAWYSDEHGWYVSEFKYSVTTSQHQGVVSTAVSNPGFYDNCRW